jgi:hypothetical protein
MAVSAALSVPSAVFEGGSKVKKIAIALVLGAMFAVGCGDKGADGAKSGAAASGSAKADAKSGGGDSGTGVAECDEYIKKWNDCYKDPAMKAAAEPGLKATKDAWKTAAETPAGKDGLKMSCKAMVDAFPAAACK